MQTRRAFVQNGIAVAALAALPSARKAFAALPREALASFKVVYDRTFSEGAVFGAAAARRGAPVHAFGGDPGPLWMHVLEPELRKGPVTVAGLTSAPSLFCFELLARDYGLGVVYRIEHERIGGGFRHAVTGHPALASWQARLAGDESWAARAAELATAHPRTLAPERSIALLDLAERPGRAAESLFSWMLAPKNRIYPVGASFARESSKNREQSSLLQTTGSRAKLAPTNKLDERERSCRIHRRG